VWCPDTLASHSSSLGKLTSWSTARSPGVSASTSQKRSVGPVSPENARAAPSRDSTMPALSMVCETSTALRE
jgi:hypothetical protein